MGRRSQVRRRAKNVLSLQCGACHARKDLALPATLRRAEPVGTPAELEKFDHSVLAAFVRPRPAEAANAAVAQAGTKAAAAAANPDAAEESVAAGVAALAAVRSLYLEGSLPAAEFVQRLRDELIRPGSMAKSGPSNGQPCPAMLAVLHSLVRSSPPPSFFSFSPSRPPPLDLPAPRS